MVRKFVGAILIGATACAFACGGDDENSDPAPTMPDAAPTADSMPAADGTTGADGSVTVPPSDANAFARAAILLASCRAGAGPLGELAIDGQEPPELLYFINAVRFGPEIDAKVLEQITCLGQKTNGCKALEECMATTVDTQPCTPKCDGTIVERCPASRRVRTDCAKYGQTCTVANGRAFCVEPGAATCTTATFKGQCDDGRPTRCDDGYVFHGPRCAAFGMLCRPQGDQDFNATCTGSGAVCNGVLKGSDESVALGGFSVGARCEGQSLVTCFAEKEVTKACSELVSGFGCFTNADAGGFAYCGLGTQCIIGEAKTYATCDGDDYVICNAGLFQRVSCKELGFARCNPQNQRCAN